ncbi:hypothetical protein [Priestia aryabhattai]|uniref:hypothetical protein n=1 Tax=Priestia aryabhattai TaxID=412384 RepID=UPI001C8D9D30|nr:hypothetical protein [Priestia aryabhattai]MBX9988184.1 hypothetical protein [Priestia aryabhattai]MBY0001577.1 hypothetical protein [Priestia aryabhattai]
MQNKERDGTVMSVLSFPKKEADCPASFFNKYYIFFTGEATVGKKAPFLKRYNTTSTFCTFCSFTEVKMFLNF